MELIDRILLSLNRRLLRQASGIADLASCLGEPYPKVYAAVRQATRERLVTVRTAAKRNRALITLTLDGAQRALDLEVEVRASS